ncbi:MAG TPA: polysaccharide biosynthesis tyrosine autokinase [Terriglobales bacterium]|nr:polysaccharide biosynthesis tyrosine autokinase [Terriglobales bacterium]
MSKHFELLQQLDPELDLYTPERRPAKRNLAEVSPVSAPSAETEWLRAWNTLRRQWRGVAIFAVSVMAAVVLVTILSKPVYEPAARVEIDPPGAELFNLEGREGSETSPEYLETQARNMQSPELLVSVMRQLQLDQNPEFKNKGFASRALNATLSVFDRAPMWLWRHKGSEVRAQLPPGLQVLSSDEASTLSSVQSQLMVKRDTASHLVNISFSSHDPVLSAQITNTLLHSFIDRSYQIRHEAIMQSTEWLSRQLDDIRTRMEQSNRALADFQSTSGIADVDQNKSTFSEQMAELSRQKTQAQAERIQLESFLLKANSGELENLPQVQNSLVIQQLNQKLGETRAELAQTLAVYGDKHPNAIRLQNQADELESQLRLQRNAILGQMQTSYAAALTREHMIDSQMRGTAKELGQMAQYAALRKDAQVNADLYNALYARIKEAGITAASKSSNIRIVDQAPVLTSPTSPKPLVNLGIGLVVALIGGIILVFGREALDTRIRTAEDVMRSTGIGTIAMMPLANGNGGAAALSAFMGSRKEHELQKPVKFLLEQPDSEQAEAIRGLHTAVMLSNPGRPPRSLLVASSLPGEGKTTVAINLAVALAQQGKTCILDADLRRSSIAGAFDLKGQAGLGDFLRGTVPLDSILAVARGVPGLTIIPAGPPDKDPGKLMNSEPMRHLLRALRERFDFVVVDSPPILPYADGRALAPFVDGVVFVGRADVVTRDAMARSIELLQEVHSAPVLEIVLNGGDAHRQSYGYGYGYKYSRQYKRAS